MAYRLARRSDFAVGLATQSALYDFWGDVALPSGSIVANLAEEEAMLRHSLWVWSAAAQPDYPPADTERPFSYRNWLELEIETLRKLTVDGATLPANFLSIVWRHSLNIASINETCPWHPFALLAPGNHPSNALRNAFLSAILADRIAGRVGLPSPQRHSVTAAALTMNWGIFQLQDRLSSSKNGLTPKDMQSIKSHPMAAGELLRQQGLANQEWLDAVEQHHEEPDGKGYPAKLLEEKTSVGGQILRACDRFVALTSSRRFRAGNTTSRARECLLKLVSDIHGIQSAISADLGPTPPGGFWREESTGRLYLSLGQTHENPPMALPLDSLDGPLPKPISGMSEMPPHDLSLTEHRLVLDRLDAICLMP